MSDILTMTAETRERAGKGAARQTRRDGRVPAVIYGGKQEPIMVSLEPIELTKHLNTGSFLASVVEVKVGKDTHRTLPRDVQFHPVTDRPLHVDFMRLSKDTKVEVAVPVEFINELAAPGIKRGGVLNVVRHEIELLCAPDSIPHSIVIDLTGLDINDSIHISHVTLPDGVESVIDRDFTIATVAAPSAMRSEAAGGDGEEEAEGDEE